jgi:hypothetical protein
VVGSAIRTLPPDAVLELLLDWHAASAMAARPSTARDRNLIDLSPP